MNNRKSIALILFSILLILRVSQASDKHDQKTKHISINAPAGLHRYAKIKAVNSNETMPDTFVELLRIGIVQDQLNKKGK